MKVVKVKTKLAARLGWTLSLTALVVGCGDTCPAGQEQLGNHCVAPETRYEPDERVDFDNVVSYSESTESTSLNLPEPPKSGFRIVMPPVELAVGQELTHCVAWPFPNIKNTLVYSARIHSTPGLHHSNVFSNLPDVELGPNPYPSCYPGASNIFGQVSQSVPDILFANSTQVIGGEWLTFPPGMAFSVHPEREIIADIHLLNTSGAPLIAEVVYDFYTMPTELLEEELAPFVVDNRLFEVAPQQTETTTAECTVWDGTIVSLMPHNHEFTTRFAVELLGENQSEQLIYDKVGYDVDSDIRVYPDGISLTGVDKMRLSCTFANTKNEPLVFGLDGQEMCVLFGYMYPPQEQFAAFQYEAEDGCVSIPIGQLQ